MIPPDLQIIGLIFLACFVVAVRDVTVEEKENP